MANPHEIHRFRSPLSGGSGRPASPGTPTSNSPSSPTRSGFVTRTTPRASNSNLPPIHVPNLSSSPPPTLVSPSRAQTHRSLAVPSTSSPSSVSIATPLASSSGPHRSTSSSHPIAVPPRPHVSTPPPRVHGSTSELRATATTSYSQSLSSPCFIHSHLDSSLAKPNPQSTTVYPGKKTRSKSSENTKDFAAKKQSAGVCKVTDEELRPEGIESRRVRDASSTSGEVLLDSNDEACYSDTELRDDEDEERGNLTRQLAETAVSVREMSKQLGRARVITHVQSVMIVTKARDNQLTRLTRELAMWLMQTPRNGKDRGLIVYVDSQLKKSKRFDAAGIEREHPDLFKPFPSQRRYSRTSSSASLATDFGGHSFHPRRSSGPTGTSTPGTNGITPLSMTNLNEALLKRNNSISSTSGASDRSEAHPARKGDQAQEGQLRYWTNDMCRKSPHLFDFVITLGGDGTVLYTSWLFQQIVPPVIPFALGSLGFLTNFDYSNFRSVLDNAIKDGIRVNLRMRFTCTVYRAVTDGDPACARRAVKSGKTGGIFMESLTREGWDAIESGKPPGKREGSGTGKDKEIKCFSTRAVESFEVLNDLVVDRGPSPYVSQLELFGDEHHMTTVQADGLTVSTPTGSTAYSLSAGGSLVHPEIPAILITPICPHTLSFRPMLLPDSMELRICVPYNSRSTAWASFDGRGRVELRQGDHIKVTASPYPFPTVCADKQSTDWFGSIQRTLKWNERQRQKSFVILEEGRKGSKSSSDPATSPSKAKQSANSETVQKHSRFAAPRNGTLDEEDDCSTSVADDDCDEDDSGEEEQEEEYDIDDISESNTTNASSPLVAPTDPIAAIPPLPLFSNTHSEPSTPTLTPAFASAPPPRDSETSSTSSSISVDIQDDGTDRFRDPRPKARGQSRARSQDTMRRALERSAERQTTSEARAFAMVGVDSDSSHSGSERE
ncbi:uncharacterized protein JCM6883_003698 [Sporobolomyces salmoneus]|uniref:uncharacterized protein n=1 Tax=Sporobolomyces salmoneus TaxID=183962 RepID=UPI00317D6A91